jgi:hypothetical protein
MSQTSYRARRADLKSNYVTAYFYKDKKFLYSQTRFQNITVNPSAVQQIIDISENGELALWQITMDMHTAIPFVQVYGDDETFGFVNDLSTDDLVSQARGLCPGDVKPVGGVNPDKIGTPMWNLSYVARYKSDSTKDAMGNSSPVFIIRWYGQLPVPYRRFVMSVQNPSSTQTLNISDVYVLRTVFVQLPTQQVQQARTLEREGEQDVIPAQEDIQGYAPPQMEEWIQGGYKRRPSP